MLAPMLVAERKSCLAKGEKLPTLFSILSYLFSGEVALGENGEKREKRKEKREKNKKGKLLRDFPLFGLPELSPVESSKSYARLYFSYECLPLMEKDF